MKRGEEKMSTDLSSFRETSFGKMPTTMRDAWTLATMLAKSSLVPKAYIGKPHDIFVALGMGVELEIHKPLQTLRSINVINGMPTVWGDMLLALAMRHPDFEDIEEKIDGDGDQRTATCIIKRKNRTPVVRTFSIAEAKRAGLLSRNGAWQSYPDRMQLRRARGFAVRDSFPEVTCGIGIVEEVNDYAFEEERPSLNISEDNGHQGQAQQLLNALKTKHTPEVDIFSTKEKIFEEPSHPEEEAAKQEDINTEQMIDEIKMSQRYKSEDNINLEEIDDDFKDFPALAEEMAEEQSSL